MSVVVLMMYSSKKWSGWCINQTKIFQKINIETTLEDFYTLISQKAIANYYQTLSLHAKLRRT